MPNIEDKLSSIKFKGLRAGERDDLWRAVLAKKTVRGFALPFNFASKSMTALLIALAVLISGGGVVAASDAAKPGDTLFGVDLAVERVQMSLASDAHRNELARTFAQERLKEIQDLRDDEDKAKNDDQDNASSSEKHAGLTEAAAVVFTNETVVKLELNGHKFGFLTQAKTKAAISTQIADKYDLEQATVEAKLVVTTEDRASRPDDKGFLNSEVRATGEVSLDDKQKHDIRAGIEQILAELKDDTSSAAVTLRAALEGILDSSASGKIKFDSDGHKTEIKFNNGSIEVKAKGEAVENEDEDEGDDVKAQFHVNFNSSTDDEDSNDDEDQDKDHEDSDHGEAKIDGKVDLKFGL